MTGVVFHCAVLLPCTAVHVQVIIASTSETLRALLVSISYGNI
jgi:hypothetical protein